uniref:TPR_REGION domain-containing protein n=1 Tax=Rhabditophanes sp. KR3021 TaxID=114890 RepID=A0AC35UAC9_9BILA
MNTPIKSDFNTNAENKLKTLALNKTSVEIIRNSHEKHKKLIMDTPDPDRHLKRSLLYNLNSSIKKANNNLSIINQEISQLKQMPQPTKRNEMLMQETPKRKYEYKRSTSKFQHINEMFAGIRIANEIDNKEKRKVKVATVNTLEEGAESNTEDSAYDFKRQTGRTLGARGIPSLMGQPTPQVLAQRSVKKTSNVYDKVYHFPRRIWPICKLINECMANKKFAQAAEMLIKLMSYIFKECGNTHRDSGAILFFSAQIFVKIRKLDMSIQLLLHALVVFKDLYGEIHISCSEVLQLLYSIYKQNGNRAEGKKMLKQCLCMKRIIFGESSLIVARLYNNLGILYEEERKWDEALNNYSEAEAIFLRCSNDEKHLDDLWLINVNILRIHTIIKNSIHPDLQLRVFNIMQKIAESKITSSDLYLLNQLPTLCDKSTFLKQKWKQTSSDYNNLNESLYKLINYYYYDQPVDHANEI